MPRVHAVIFSSDGQARISVEDWGNGEPAGIVPLTDTTDNSLFALRDFAEENVPSGLKFIPDQHGLNFEEQNPRLVIFRFEGKDWAARGFRPWGTARPGDPAVGLVASSEDSDASEGARWAKAAAGLLYHIRTRTGLPSQATPLALDLVPLVQVDDATIFPTLTDVEEKLLDDSGSAADFGNAADSGD